MTKGLSYAAVFISSVLITCHYRYHGIPEKCLSLYQRACFIHVDAAERLFEAYLCYVREEGTLEEYYIALGKIQQRRRHILEIQIKVD
jgi:hypothetical protein